MLPADFSWFGLLMGSLSLLAGHEQYPHVGWFSRVLLSFLAIGRL